MFANPKHEEAYQLVKSGAFDQALELFSEALEITPSHPDILSDRGVLFIHLNDREKALQDFNAAIEVQPEYSFRYSARAYAYDYFGETERAISDYERAIELDPKDAVAHNNLGLLQEKLGYKQKAEQNFERADRLSKMEARLYDLIDELEDDKTATPAQDEVKPAQQRAVIEPQEKREAASNSFSEFKRLFTSKEQFSSFLKFLKNGFRIK